MGMMSTCSSCGSDWCSNCECVRHDIKKRLQVLAEKWRAECLSGWAAKEDAVEELLRFARELK